MALEIAPSISLLLTLKQCCKNILICFMMIVISMILHM